MTTTLPVLSWTLPPRVHIGGTTTSCKRLGHSSPTNLARAGGTVVNIASGDTAIRGITYFTTKEFDKALSKSFLAGGQQQKKALKVKAILGSLRDENPFASVSVTDHGENRVSKCVKYHLGDGW